MRYYLRWSETGYSDDWTEEVYEDEHRLMDRVNELACLHQELRLKVFYGKEIALEEATRVKSYKIVHRL